jgi:hypothetical protein
VVIISQILKKPLGAFFYVRASSTATRIIFNVQCSSKSI